MRAWIPSITASLLLASTTLGQSGEGYDLSWSTIDGGGATYSTGSGYELGGTIGQPDASTALTGSGYSLTGGFWVAVGPPSVPLGVDASDGSRCDAVSVSWWSASRASSYKVYRSESSIPCPGTEIASTVDTSFYDTSAQPGVTYYYSVKATNGWGDSACSDVNAGYVGTGPLAAPSGLIATQGTHCMRVQLSWDAVPNAWTYKIYRGTSDTPCPAPQLATVTETHWSDSVVMPGVTYYYSVQASSSTCGDSPCSVTVSGSAGMPTMVIVDNTDPGFSVVGTGWQTGSSGGGACPYGSNYRYHARDVEAGPYACWTAPNPAPGQVFLVGAWWPASASNATDAPFVVYSDSGATVVRQNQQGPSCSLGNNRWVFLGRYQISGPTLQVRLRTDIASSSQRVVADAITWAYCPPEPSMISGRVTDGFGAGLVGVTLSGLPDPTITDANGYYSDLVPPGWSGRVTPTRANCAFTPAYRDYDNVTDDQPAQDYSVACVYAPADFNRDGDVDLDDYAVFEACVSGPAVVYAGDCAKADFDHDGDVDMPDFGVFQRCFSGANQPADADCAN